MLKRHSRRGIQFKLESITKNSVEKYDIGKKEMIQVDPHIKYEEEDTVKTTIAWS